MIRHPAEVATEIKSFPFFKNFDEGLLLQVATMMKEIVCPAGSSILVANKPNNRLYFLKKGVLEVLVDGENIAEVMETGEVIGDMSALTGSLATADTIAQTESSFYYLEIDDFQNVLPAKRDRFQFLLYKIYAHVLNDRLVKTNQKAKLYEITARELAEKKRELELITMAQLNFFRADLADSARSVLCLESNKKNQNIMKTAIASSGMKHFWAQTLEEVRQIFSENLIQIIVADESFIPLLVEIKNEGFKGEVIIIADTQMKYETVALAPFVNTIITRNPDDKAANIRSLLTAFTKIFHRSYFGAEKYLALGTELKKHKVSSSKQRKELNETMVSDLKSLGIRSALLDQIQLVAEEMLMNAVYDAPTGNDGKSLFNHLARTEDIVLSPHQYSELRYGFDGNLVAISVTDPFGSLSKDLILKYLESCYKNSAGSLNTQKGGAGRGLHQIIESSHFTIFNIEKWVCTEVITLFEIDKKEDTPPQLQIFIVS